jgi:hypothetical protein
MYVVWTGDMERRVGGDFNRYLYGVWAGYVEFCGWG